MRGDGNRNPGHSAVLRGRGDFKGSSETIHSVSYSLKTEMAFGYSAIVVGIETASVVGDGEFEMPVVKTTGYFHVSSPAVANCVGDKFANYAEDRMGG